LAVYVLFCLAAQPGHCYRDPINLYSLPNPETDRPGFYRRLELETIRRTWRTCDLRRRLQSRMNDDRFSREPSTPNDPAVYEPHVNTTFAVDVSPEAVPLTLASVEDEGVQSGGRRFSLLFHGAPERLLHPDTYVLRHDVLGPLLLFITPIQGSTRQRIVYQACFDVHVDPAGFR
jgi:hypothetical protein